MLIRGSTWARFALNRCRNATSFYELAGEKIGLAICGTLPSLLTLLSAREFFHDLTPLPCLYLFTRILH